MKHPSRPSRHSSPASTPTQERPHRPLRHTLPLAVLILIAAPLWAAPTALGVTGEADAERRRWDHESSDIPPDPRIQFGRLDNGLRFAWANNPEPKHRCYLRLHVDVGSLAEEDDETGMAHFLEHMAFNGTRHFAANDLILWFQNHGMEFGADTNAMTSYSETIYMIDLPSGEERPIRDGLQVLRDFADGMLLLEEEVQAEKGVIDGEQRERDSAETRMLFGSFDHLYAGTRVASRNPIGKAAVRAAFTRETALGFYRRWYRPENLTLVLVGDLGDLDAAALIEDAFADMTPPDQPWVAEPPLGTPSLEDRAFSVYEPETPALTVTIRRLRPYESRPVTAERWREEIPLSAAYGMLNLRLSELSRQSDPPFLAASISDNQPQLHLYEGSALRMICEPDRFQTALNAADLELRRALKFGFQASDLAAIQAEILSQLDDAAKRDAKRDSRLILAEILHACENRHVPVDATTRRAILRPVAEALTLEACHEALIDAWRGALVVSTQGPLEIESDALMAALEQARETEPTPRDDIGAGEFAYASSPDDPPTATGTYIEDLDVHQYSFENGVRVNVKQTDFDDREVVIVVDLSEGQLTIPPEHAAFNNVIDQAFLAGGLEAHSADELRRLLAGRMASVSFSCYADTFSFAADTNADDLLLACERIVAHVQHPGWRDQGLARIKTQLPLVLDGLAHRVDGPLVSEFLPAFYNHDPRFQRLPTAEQVNAIEIEDLRAWLDPELQEGPVEVTIVGAVDPEQAISCVARTFGRLPPRRAWSDHAERRKAAAPRAGLRMRRTVETASEQALVYVAYPTTDGMETTRRRLLLLLGSVLNERIRVEIRERLGASYSPQADSDLSEAYPGVGEIQMFVSCNPDAVDTVAEACLDIGRSLAEDGVTDDEVHRATEPLLAQIRDRYRSNTSWARFLRDAHRTPASLDDTRSYPAFFESVTADQLAPYASRYLKPENASILIVVPASD